MYYGIVTKLKEVQKHPNADRLKIAKAAGNTVIVGLNANENDIGIYFGDDGVLTKQFLEANDLIERFDKDGKKINSGYFKENGVVKKQKLRGIKSDGLFIGLESLKFTGVDISSIKEDDKITTVNNILICEKRYTEATLRQMKAGSRNRVNKEYATFKKHFDTPQLKLCAKEIPINSVIYITEKLHGTSGRSGYCAIPENKYKGFLGKILDKLNLNPIAYSWKYMCGSRSVNIKENHVGFYGVENFRIDIHNKIKPFIRKGEVFYYEIVGYTDSGKYIMPPHSTKELEKEKDFIEKFGNEIKYTYGCDVGKHDFYVYRITSTNEDGDTIEYSFQQVIKRCEEIGIKHVPILYGPSVMSDHDAILLLAERLTDGVSSKLDEKIPSEGVCVRYDGKTSGILKLKSWYFGVCEGYIKNNKDYVDTEEVA